MRRRNEFDFDRVLVFVDVVPLTVGVPTGGDYLDQNFPLRDLRDLHRTILIRFKIHFSELIVMQKSSLCVKADIDARIGDRLAGVCQDMNAQLGHRRLG